MDETAEKLATEDAAFPMGPYGPPSNNTEGHVTRSVDELITNTGAEDALPKTDYEGKQLATSAADDEEPVATNAPEKYSLHSTDESESELLQVDDVMVTLSAKESEDSAYRPDRPASYLDLSLFTLVCCLNCIFGTFTCQMSYMHRQTSHISRTKSPKLIAFRLVLHSSLSNLLKPGG